jgi:hypothetical protein
MKRFGIVSIALLFAFSLGVANAQTENPKPKKEARIEKKAELKALRKLEGKITSESTKIAFYNDFGNIPNVVFVRREFMDEARFIKDGHEMIAYYDNLGKLIGTTKSVTFDQVPYKAQKLINKKYPGYKVENVIFFNDNEANDTDMMQIIILLHCQRKIKNLWSRSILLEMFSFSKNSKQLK